MSIREVEAKSVLLKHKKIDSWFISHYGMNLYRGCHHNCVYCDGRNEKYQVEGEFGKDIAVKINAIDVLKKEFDPKRKRIPFKKSYVMIGGGVGDSYQPVEKIYELTKRTLQLLKNYEFPIHILTKSTLVKRDIGLIKDLNDKNGAIVSFSFSSVDNKICSILEPGVPSPDERLETLEIMKDEGIATGMFLLPVVPYLTDSQEQINESVKRAKDARIDFIIFGNMTLKEGEQKEYFLNKLKRFYPNITDKCNSLYQGDKWGNPKSEYIKRISMRFDNISNKHNMPKRIPLRLFKDVLDENDLATVMLEHIDYQLRLEGKSSSFGYAAYSISNLKIPISQKINDLTSIKGVGPRTEKIIKEIIETGTSSYYEKMFLR